MTAELKTEIFIIDHRPHLVEREVLPPVVALRVGGVVDVVDQDGTVHADHPAARALDQGRVLGSLRRDRTEEGWTARPSDLSRLTPRQFDATVGLLRRHIFAPLGDDR